jgi:hypothetical protein
MNEFERDLAAHVDGLTPVAPPPFDGVIARQKGRRTRRRAVIATLGSAAAIIAIVGGASLLRPDGSAEEPPVTAPDSSRTTDVAPEWDRQDPPPIVLRLDGEQVVLAPWTSCYGNTCIDGFPQPPFADVGDRDEVPFSFPLDGWTFEATFSPAGEARCERTFTVPVEKTGDRTFAVPVAGPPAAYDVNVFGSGPGGDVIVTFTWTTTKAGSLPEPSGFAGIVTDNDEELDSYGVEIGLDALAGAPRDVSATVTVTAANGRSTTIGPLAQGEGCAGDGTVSFIGSEAEGKRAAALGPAPFDYRVEVTLDGKTYVGTAVWPRDEQPDLAPYTTLTFDPPLPAYTG